MFLPACCCGSSSSNLSSSSWAFSMKVKWDSIVSSDNLPPDLINQSISACMSLGKFSVNTMSSSLNSNVISLTTLDTLLINRYLSRNAFLNDRSLVALFCASPNNLYFSASPDCVPLKLESNRLGVDVKNSMSLYNLSLYASEPATSYCLYKYLASALPVLPS